MSCLAERIFYHLPLTLCCFLSFVNRVLLQKYEKMSPPLETIYLADVAASMGMCYRSWKYIPNICFFVPIFIVLNFFSRQCIFFIVSSTRNTMASVNTGGDVFPTMHKESQHHVSSTLPSFEQHIFAKFPCAVFSLPFFSLIAPLRSSKTCSHQHSIQLPSQLRKHALDTLVQ